MKFIHVLPVLAVAAAFGAAHALPGSSSHALAGQASPELASVVPPWLAEHAGEDGEDGEDGEAAYVAGDDPHADHVHADTYAGVEDPHGGVYPEPEPDDEDPYQRVGLEPTPEVSVTKVERSTASNGRSVAEVYAAREKLAGQTLRVRATVVKRNEGILGKTYLHLRDGSGSADQGDDDLTATTTEPFELGETVEVEGELAIDQDVGAGYVYSALLTKLTRIKP
ncbi:MAG TPA: hypothetical protein VMG12_20820 [Polyangiaceae bacterium]|nr:hypothetical protein [Polyangiaceae bacterium]